MPGRLSSATQWIVLEGPLLAGELMSGDWPQLTKTRIASRDLGSRFFEGPKAQESADRGAELRGSGDESTYDDGKTCHHLLTEG